TNNGVGFNKTWKWVPANKSLTINLVDDSIVILHPQFVNNTILALELDGTNKYTFLIDENNKRYFEPKTLTQLLQYFELIEKKAIEAEYQRQQLSIQKAKDDAKKKAYEAQRLKSQQIANENKMREERLWMKSYDILHPKSFVREKLIIRLIYIICFVLIIYYVTNFIPGGIRRILDNVISFMILVFSFFFYLYFMELALHKYIYYRVKYIKNKYIKEHPNDHTLNKYLEQRCENEKNY
ncbi:MAG: hypothetical protein IJ925_05030, partial [Muribaculaceae bacterium]|nr:hypothetical protein [Muribaculaceae bacterium]